MTLVLTPEALWIALVIFILRLINQSLDTLRILVMMRGRRLAAWIFGFAETVIFVITLSSVINDLDNILNIVAYSGGFATGNILGLALEHRLALGHISLRVISPKRGSAIMDKLRKDGYGVTEIPARGKDGAVTLLNLSIKRKDVEKVRKIIQAVDENSFITGEEMRPIWRGFWGT